MFTAFETVLIGRLSRQLTLLHTVSDKLCQERLPKRSHGFNLLDLLPSGQESNLQIKSPELMTFLDCSVNFLLFF